MTLRNLRNLRILFQGAGRSPHTRLLSINDGGDWCPLKAETLQAITELKTPTAA